MITILDYGIGNIASVKNAFDRLNIECSCSKDLTNSAGVVIPGVGSFRTAVESLKDQNLFEPVRDFLKTTNTPVLGICLGMQLLFEGSDEGGKTDGFGLIEGWITRIPINIGWRPIEVRSGSPLYQTRKEGSTYFFDHEYAFCKQTEYVEGTLELGYSVSVRKGSIFGVQFHPEKSQNAGLRVLREFERLTK